MLTVRSFGSQIVAVGIPTFWVELAAPIGQRLNFLSQNGSLLKRPHGMGPREDPSHSLQPMAHPFCGQNQRKVLKSYGEGCVTHAEPEACLSVLPAWLPILVRDGTPSGRRLDGRRVRWNRSIPRGQILIDRIAGWRTDQGAVCVSRGREQKQNCYTHHRVAIACCVTLSLPSPLRR